MVSFYPGPSRVYDTIPAYVKDAVKEGIVSINHRSPEFIALAKKTDRLLKQKLSIPKNYTILYTSSATECWEILAQSLSGEKSYHLFNGAFGKKWFDYTVALNHQAEGILFSREEALHPEEYVFPYQQALICLTQNETSNGTQVSNDILKRFRSNNPGAIIAVDATSSMAGIFLDFKQADVWFASVQKCFGLPAGLAVMVCSPKAIERVRNLNERLHYNSLPAMVNMMEVWQTTHTPNVLAIYLLMRVMEKQESIKAIHKQTQARFKQWKDFIQKQKGLSLLIENSAVQSQTVLPIISDPFNVSLIKSKAKKAGYILGEGYGDLKSTTFRIANFPALQTKEIKALQKFLSDFKSK
ncbi:alanine--glyoxylate aminotransferase family protein [Chryseotalea sanaruensis]|uniref:phosphoserine transaminase n=1 Tax=Chryseotalea sanaruensis TaxID=2482724 RepID=A0A401U5H7_9BACT|nr:aminotransferase class V-fold PLP-dependent enzyme [Chryseotalea sanaruensis]GCC50183.1 alanine--glyoxylate aminotransferase family protein [Chryseotalea sanaruensis]